MCIVLIAEVHCAAILYEHSTCTECEEEEFNLLAFWEQLNEVKLKRNHVNAVLRGQSFSCTHRESQSLRLHLSNRAIHTFYITEDAQFDSQ